MISRAALSLCLAIGLAATSGCTTAAKGPRFPETLSARTGAGLIEQLGAPSAVRRDGDGKLLRWDADMTRGLTFGLAYSGARLVLSKREGAQDRVYARVGPDDRVRELRVLRGSDDLGYSLWPFSP